VPNAASRAGYYFERALRNGFTWMVRTPTPAAPEHSVMLNELAAALEAVSVIGNAGMLAGSACPAEQSHIEVVADGIGGAHAYRGTAISPGTVRIVRNIVERVTPRVRLPISLSVTAGAGEEHIPTDVISHWRFPGGPDQTNFRLIDEMLEPPPNDPVVRFEFRTPVDAPTLSALEHVAQAWERVINMGGFVEVAPNEPIDCQVTYSELYLSTPTLVEYPLVGLFDSSEPFLLWIVAATKLARQSNPLVSLELQ